MKTENPKDRIYNCSLELFARKGFSGVGVREIAKTADVNISMISYYYGGKAGILREIAENFFDQYFAIIQKTLGNDGLTDEKAIRKFIGEIVEFIRNNGALCKVGLFEFPDEVPEVTDLKAEKIRMFRDFFMKENKGAIGRVASDLGKMTIIGPALLSMVFSNFLIGKIVEQVIEKKFDDEFYEKYVETISSIFIHGVGSVL